MWLTGICAYVCKKFMYNTISLSSLFIPHSLLQEIYQLLQGFPSLLKGAHIGAEDEEDHHGNENLWAGRVCPVRDPA